MKNKYNYINVFLVILSFCMAISLTSCKKTDSDSGMPSINYIRVTDVLKSDSLVTRAFMANTIAIMGQDLQDIGEIWFNDKQAKLNTVFITSSSIIVTIPNEIPGKVTNMMYLIKKNKLDTLKYPFRVDVPSPTLSSMLCEYVETGKTAVIKGNYFLGDANTPLKVFFPGNIEGTVTKYSVNEIQVTVPAGVGSGPITVKSMYGSTRSTFYFRDDRNIILNFDDLNANGGWRSGKTGNSSPDPISGNYVRFQGAMSGAAGATWDEDSFSFNLWNQANGRANSPLYTGDLTKACIKFEVNVVSDWKAGAMQMIFTPYSTTGTNAYIGDASVPRGLWNPWQASGKFKTDGWITVSVPLSDFKYTPVGKESANKLSKDMLGGLTFFVWAGGVDGADCTPHICIDNIRIVPM